MNAPRFYCREALAPGALVELPAPVVRHAVRVLRLGPGDPVVLFDGRGGEYPALLQRIEKERAWAELGAWQDVECESPLAITLIQSLQAGDKMDFTIQKAVELGVRAIVPVESRRSVLKLAGERAGKRVAHWQAIAVSACEQSGRTAVPWVRPLLSLDAFLQQGIASRSALASDRAVGAAHEPAAARWVLSLQADAQPLRQALQAAQAMQSIWLLSGPEGGLDDAEEALAMQQGWTPVSLGACTLRAETAPVAALAAWSICREPIESQGR